MFEAGTSATNAAATFEQRLIELANGQLGPGGSLTTASQVVEDAMMNRELAGTVDAHRRWDGPGCRHHGSDRPVAQTRWARLVRRNPRHQDPDESPVALGSFCARPPRAALVQAGGITLVLTPANVSVLDSFDMLFRPASRAARFKMSSTDVVELRGACVRARHHG